MRTTRCASRASLIGLGARLVQGEAAGMANAVGQSKLWSIVLMDRSPYGNWVQACSRPCEKHLQRSIRVILTQHLRSERKSNLDWHRVFKGIRSTPAHRDSA